MSIILKEVLTKSDRKEFIYFPETIRKGDNTWLQPLYLDEKSYFDPSKNLSFRNIDYKQVIAYKDGKAVGRIMGIIQHEHNQLFNIKNGRFGFLECINDKEVATVLVKDIEKWAKSKGMDKIIGPYGFSDRDIQGVLIEGFDYEPVVDSATNPAYLPALIENQGYTKELDCVIFRFPLATELPEIYQKVYARVTSKKDLKFMEFTSRKQLKPLIIPVLNLVNESFKDIYGFIPMDEKEMMELAKRYMPILDPRFVKIVMKDDEVVAFLISMPNLYKGLQKAKGRLLPFGIIHILRAMKTAKTCNTMLGAVKPSYQKQGLDIFLSLTTINSAKKAKMTSVDTHVVMENNNDMMAEMKRYGAFLIKRYRVYQKTID